MQEKMFKKCLWDGVQAKISDILIQYAKKKIQENVNERVSRLKSQIFVSNMQRENVQENIYERVSRLKSQIFLSNMQEKMYKKMCLRGCYKTNSKMKCLSVMIFKQTIVLVCYVKAIVE